MMQVQKLSSQDVDDFVDLIQVFGRSFEMQRLELPNEDYLKRLLEHPDFFVFVVKLNELVIGGLTVYVLHGYYSELPTAYIYDLGILPEHQRKGAGKMLINHLMEFCKNNNFENAYVEAEADDFDAINFYKSTRPDEILEAVHFSYDMKKW